MSTKVTVGVSITYLGKLFQISEYTITKFTGFINKLVFMSSSSHSCLALI